jgi:hypothetical protein
MMLAQTVAMVFLDDKQGLGSRRIYWERKDRHIQPFQPLWLAKEGKERKDRCTDESQVPSVVMTASGQASAGARN